MAHKVFLSFSAKDKRVADSLVKHLREAGVEIADAESIADGAEIKLRITEAMRQSDEVVAIVTDNSAQSPWFNFEIGAAMALGKKLTPVLAGVGVKHLSPVLRSLKAINLADFRRRILRDRKKSEK
jgi:hypothetical protein